jgi:hypothetical protein
VEEARFRDGTYLPLHSECLIENNTKISYTGNITDNSTIEGKMAILEVSHMIFRGKNNQFGLILIEF